MHLQPGSPLLQGSGVAKGPGAQYLGWGAAHTAQHQAACLQVQPAAPLLQQPEPGHRLLSKGRADVSAEDWGRARKGQGREMSTLTSRDGEKIPGERSFRGRGSAEESVHMGDRAERPWSQGAGQYGDTLCRALPALSTLL